MDRDKLIQGINARLTPPTPDEARTLTDEFGCASWGEYIVDQAENTGVRVGTALAIFDMLGPSEAFDGFVTSLEDAEACFE